MRPSVRIEPRAVIDPESTVPGERPWIRVVIATEARPKHKFDVLLTVPEEPPSDWDPQDIESRDEDLWRVTDIKITGVRYGLPSNDFLAPGTVGWVLRDYYGRDVLLLAECS